MKTINKMVFLTFAAALSVQAATMVGSFQTKLSPGKIALETRPPMANELTLDGKSYSGIAVQLFNAPQPLQLINPLAPASYGNGEQNVVRDPIDGHIVGLKVLSIDFQ